MKASLLSDKWTNPLLAAAFALLATVAGMAAGAPTLPLGALVATFLALFLMADSRGWLRPPTDNLGERTIRPYAVTFLFVVFAVLYVTLTGGPASPLMAALYLPVVLAVVCFRTRVGVFSSLGMGAFYAVCATWEGHRLQTPARGDISVVLSFPLVALFTAILTRGWRDAVRALQARASEMSALLDMSQMMDSAIDLDTTLNLTLLNVQRLSDCQICAVYLKDASGANLELRAASGPRDRVALVSLLPLNEAECGDWTLNETGQRFASVSPCYVPDTNRPTEAQAGSRLLDLDRHARSFACVPLNSVEGLLGMLYVGYDRPHGLADGGVQRLENLAVRAAFSLQRAVLQQGFRSLAFTDAMTGLDNFRQFEETLAEEMRRAERYERPLSVLLLDIDYFKKFNDTLGHQAGDALLAQLATVLRDSLRSVDRPARYGGEEFVVVCPETGPDEAHLIAERIRRNVEATPFALVDKGPDGGDGASGTTHVTVSVGFATFPGDAQAGRDLVKRADEALYAAKRAGRNAVRGHQDSHLRVVAA